MADSRISIMTSRSEGLPLAIIESMAVGTPVVAMDCKYGPSDLIIDGVTGYVVQDRDIQVFADRVCELLTNDRLRQDMSEAGRRWVTDNLSAESITQKWTALFDSLA